MKRIKWPLWIYSFSIVCRSYAAFWQVFLVKSDCKESMPDLTLKACESYRKIERPRRVNCLMKGIVDTDRNPAIEKIVNFPEGVIHDSH